MTPRDRFYFCGIGKPIHSTRRSALRIAAIKTRTICDAAAVIDVGGEGEQREVLTVHVVLQIEHARKTGACDLLFGPRAVGFLRTEEKAQTSLNTWPIEIAARA